MHHYYHYKNIIFITISGHNHRNGSATSYLRGVLPYSRIFVCSKRRIAKGKARIAIMIVIATAVDIIAVIAIIIMVAQPSAVTACTLRMRAPNNVLIELLNE